MYSFRKSKKGFTLIELMVVVAIIAVLSLLGIRVYTGQATKAKNASVQANIHSLATELGVQILDEASPTYSLATAQTAAATAQLVNPFQPAAVKGAALVVDTEPDEAAGYIVCTEVSGAYHLVGLGHDESPIVITDVNFE